MSTRSRVHVFLPSFPPSFLLLLLTRTCLSFRLGQVAWFPDGYLNVSVNCLDRHPPEQTAIIWEGDDPADVLRITYAEALAATCQLANALKTKGVRKGDRVCLYMPMVPWLGLGLGLGLEGLPRLPLHADGARGRLRHAPPPPSS